MQDFIDQAKKNGVILSDKGRCQCCGADFQKGIFGCMDHYNQGLELIDFGNTENHLYRFLSVDAHALQHPEIHGRWSNHFHLTRLHLMCDKKVHWEYKKSTLLSEYLNKYKSSRLDEFLAPPSPLERGVTTTRDFLEVSTASACCVLIIKWAEEVYGAWRANHSVVAQIAEGFIREYHQGGNP